MKISVVFLIATVIGMTSSASSYAAGWNADIFAGKQKLDNTHRGRSQGVRISKQVTPRTSVGFEVGYNKNKHSHSNPNYITGTTAMLTSKYNFVNYGRFQAYGGVGLGFARVRNNNHRDTVAAGQLSLGARVAVTRRSGLFLEARHLDTFNHPKVGGASGTGVKYQGNSVVLGWSYKF